MTKKYRTEVAIAGGGPAGLSAASWCGELGLDTLLIERKPDIGGQLHQIYGPIENYLGLRARDGDEMLSHFRASVDRSRFRRVLGSGVESVDAALREIRLTDGDIVNYGALIIATGVRRRKLNVEGETEFLGKGVLASGVRDHSLAAGRDVVIVGGGDAAVENALILAGVAASVKLVHRRDELTARTEFLTSLNEKDNIEIIRNAVVKEIQGAEHVTGVEIESVSSREVSRLPADFVLIRIGVEPNSEFIRGVVEMDERGYIQVDASGETNVMGVYAAGDVANPGSPTLSTAAGMGATAAKSAYTLIKTQQSGV